MSIQDITKMSALYAQPSQFDQEAWKSAFDIYNAFTNAEDKRTQANDNYLKHKENLATSDWRVAYQNNVFQTGVGKNNLSLADDQRKYNNALKTDPSQIASEIAKNNYATTAANLDREGLLGKDEALKMVQNYAWNPDGTPRTLPEAYQAMVADGKTLASPYAFAPVWQAANQKRENQYINQLGALKEVLGNSMKTTLDPMGNVVQTGEVDPQLLDQRLTQAIATGAITKEQAEAFKGKLFPAAPNPVLPPTGLNSGSFTELYKQLLKGNAPQAPDNMVVPYALNNSVSTPTPIAPTTVAPAQTPSMPVHRAEINLADLSEQDLGLLNQYQAATGLDQTQAFKALMTNFMARKNGRFTPEETEQRILREIEIKKKAMEQLRWYQNNQKEIEGLMPDIYRY